MNAIGRDDVRDEVRDQLHRGNYSDKPSRESRAIAPYRLQNQADCICQSGSRMCSAMLASLNSRLARPQGASVTPRVTDVFPYRDTTAWQVVKCNGDVVSKSTNTLHHT